MTTPSDTGLSPAELTELRGRVLTTMRDRRRRRTSIRIIAPAGMLAAATALTAGVFVTQPAPIPQQNGAFTCYTTNDPNGPHSGVAGPAAAASAGRPSSTELLPMEHRIQQALELCGLHYTGRESSLPGARIISPPIDAPNPTVCLERDKTLAVFPNPESLPVREFCASVGRTAP